MGSDFWSHSCWGDVEEFLSLVGKASQGIQCQWGDDDFRQLSHKHPGENADPIDGNKIAKYNSYTNKRLCYGEDGQGEEWPQAPDISDGNLLAQAHHPCPLRRGTGKSHVVRRMIICVELLDVSTSAAHVHQENGRSTPPFLWSLTGTPCKSESSTPSNVHDGQRCDNDAELWIFAGATTVFFH